MVAPAAFDEPRARGRVRHPDDLGSDLGAAARGGHRGGPGQAVPGGAAGVARPGRPGRTAGPGVIRTTRAAGRRTQEDGSTSETAVPARRQYQRDGSTSKGAISKEARWPGSATQTATKEPPR